MNFNIHDLFLLMPEDFLLGATCAILLIDLFLKPAQRSITHWLSLAALLGTIALILADSDPAVSAFNGAYIHDKIAAAQGVHPGISAVVFVYARGYARSPVVHRRVLPALPFSILGMLLLVSAGNLGWCIWGWNCSRCRRMDCRDQPRFRHRFGSGDEILRARCTRIGPPVVRHVDDLRRRTHADLDGIRAAMAAGVGIRTC